jgi:hypothetical protein
MNTPNIPENPVTTSPATIFTLAALGVVAMLFNIVSLSMRFGDYDYDIVTRQVVETMAQVLFLTFALYSVSSKFESVSSKFGEPGETRIFYGLGATAYVLAISKFLLVMNGNVSFTTEVVGALNTIAQLIFAFYYIYKAVRT